MKLNFLGHEVGRSFANAGEIGEVQLQPSCLFSRALFELLNCSLGSVFAPRRQINLSFLF